MVKKQQRSSDCVTTSGSASLRLEGELGVKREKREREKGGCGEKNSNKSRRLRETGQYTRRRVTHDGGGEADEEDDALESECTHRVQWIVEM